MLLPICDDNALAAALLDWLYLYFQRPSPYEIFFEKLRKCDEEVITDDFYLYQVREYLPPFDLDREAYPDHWLSVSLAECFDAIRSQFSSEMTLQIEDFIEAFKLLQNKSYLSVEDWGLFEEDREDCLNGRYKATLSPLITCYLSLAAVDSAVQKQYQKAVPISSFPLENSRIDKKRERRIITNQVHRAKRIGQAASLTLEEWLATLNHFKVKCAFCRERSYEVLEHFIPVIHGGSTSVFNCIPACEICNAIKNEQLPHEFEQHFENACIQELLQYLEQKRKEWLCRQTS